MLFLSLSGSRAHPGLVDHLCPSVEFTVADACSGGLVPDAYNDKICLDLQGLPAKTGPSVPGTVSLAFAAFPPQRDGH